MAPIRVGIIGLSSSATTAWASFAHLPYLLSPRGQSKFKVVALLNSSVDAAKAAISTYKLSPDTRAYGDPASLAADPDVDLVICNTRVDKHYDTIYPSVAAGKSIYTEWPLAPTAQQARELVALAKKSGSKTMIGLQGHQAPLALKVRELIEQGRIGKVISSEARAAGGTLDRQSVPESLSYFYERKIGGNQYTIIYGHTFDLLQFVLGEAVSPYGHFQLQRPEGKIFNSTTKKYLPSVQSDVPDLIISTSTLPESPFVEKNASLLYRLRRGQPFPGDPQFDWAINGEKGEIRVISEESAVIQAFIGIKRPTIQVHDFETNQVENVEWGWEEWQDELPVQSRNVGAMYEAFADGKRYPTFEHAAVRHEQLEGMLAHWKA